MTRIKLIQGDITQLEVDAIVNAANTSLLGGSGVDGAIHRAGGPSILTECIQIRNKQGGCKTGEAVVTRAGNMKANYIIHTVGPVWNGGGNGELTLLANAYRNSLLRATENNCQTIAFPNISTGIYGFPKHTAADVAIREIKLFLSSATSLQVIFCCFDAENYVIYQNLLNT